MNLTVHSDRLVSVKAFYKCVSYLTIAGVCIVGIVCFFKYDGGFSYKYSLIFRVYLKKF